MAGERPSDAELCRKCRQGDSGAWRLLVRRYSPVAYRLSVRMLGFGSEAEDAVQETFLRVFRSFDTFDPARPIKPWLSRVAYNVCLRRLGKAGRRNTDTTDPEELDRLGDERQPNPEGRATSSESRGLVSAALEKLPIQDRVLVELHYREGLSLAEVSEATGIPVNTIKTRMHRARGKLRQELAPVLTGRM